MAITKNDCLLLLTKMQEDGVDTKAQVNKLFSNPGIPLDVLKFINNHKQLDVISFYERIRKNYNNKRSKLYINIMKEIDDPEEIITTLSALLTQIILTSEKVDNKKLFLNNVRAGEITRVLNNYFNTFDVESARKLLHLFKCDIKALESIRN